MLHLLRFSQQCYAPSPTFQQYSASSLSLNSTPPLPLLSTVLCHLRFFQKCFAHSLSFNSTPPPFLLWTVLYLLPCLLRQYSASFPSFDSTLFVPFFQTPPLLWIVVPLLPLFWQCSVTCPSFGSAPHPPLLLTVFRLLPFFRQYSASSPSFGRAQYSASSPSFDSALSPPLLLTVLHLLS